MHLLHGRTTLALHELQPGAGPALLLLHELHGSAADWRAETITWPGPVYALDFSGHGESEALHGGAYSCEMLLADADCALAHCDASALAGIGLGAYIALLLSGARAQALSATLLLSGRGLAGGGNFPRFERLLPEVADKVPAAGRPDPYLDYFENDVRPADYAIAFAARAQSLILLNDQPDQPPWWRAVATMPGTACITDNRERAFAELARRVGGF